MSLNLPRGWWGYHWSPPHPRSITELIRARTLDAELAALLWLLVEARVPILVASRLPLAGKSTLLTALLEFLPDEARPVVLRGSAERFTWLPEAEALGWTRDLVAATDPGEDDGDGSRRRWAGRAAEPSAPLTSSTGYLLASELSDHLPAYTWGLRARVAIRAASLGYGFASTIHADSLAEVMDQLSSPPVSLTADELRGLGVVLVLRLFDRAGRPLPDRVSSAMEFGADGPDVLRRVVAAHYVRPLERDAGGHVQRRPPAVLAARDDARDELEHFAWGVAPELAERTGTAPRQFDREHAERTALLDDLARRGVVDRAAVAEAVAARRASAGARRPADPARTAAQPEALRTTKPFLADGLVRRPHPLPPEAQ